MKKRIQVVYRTEVELTPIEVAIDEMHSKAVDIQDVVDLQRPDFKKLQLKLQGSVSVQVNAGPLAYAQAFLKEGTVHKYQPEKIRTLKDTYRY